MKPATIPERSHARGSPSSTTRVVRSASRTRNASVTATRAWRSGTSRTTPRRSATCRSTSARNGSLDLFEQYRPDVVITYADNGGYNHPDHVHAHRITVAAVERSTVPAKLYLIARRRRDWQAMRDRLADARRGVPAAPAAEPRTTRADGAASKSRSPPRSTCARSPIANGKRSPPTAASSTSRGGARSRPICGATSSARSRSSACTTRRARPYPRPTSSPGLR